MLNMIVRQVLGNLARKGLKDAVRPRDEGPGDDTGAKRKRKPSAQSRAAGRQAGRAMRVLRRMGRF